MCSFRDAYSRSSGRQARGVTASAPPSLDRGAPGEARCTPPRPNAPARRTPALPRLRGSPAALGRGVPPGHSWRPMRSALRRQSGALSNYALKPTGAN
jgi:hypothetical protein